MEDRGGKIITLAHEMLRASMVFESEVEPKLSISFKMRCFATMLTAITSGLVTSWASEGRRPVNRYERTELNALIFYAARLKGANEELIRRDVQEKLGIGSFDDLTEGNFPIARRYLQAKAQ